MIGLSANLQYYLCCKPVDMRNGFDGLSGIVRNELKQDPVSGSVFIFINRTGTHIKLLFWDGDGFALFYKRLERGRYSIGDQDKTTPARLITREELMMILEGLSFKNLKRKKRFKIS
ncbi:IS66 Orf2 like protein [Marinilabilia salmonicolor]|uniref:IS66 family insertion sequence element accessory protein TnpB n=1 Tax=Marinilabilia salmonicolor TaxID=989 RepID=UPI000D058C9B|nr:IS66 family insertion sequence element accessory protein TnpB [Marinilabilia salmonicolor]PRY85345.1 IS66 Orf2 like protein [Marinilabilia salmonicolor]